ETDIGAGAVRLMNLDCDDISAVYQKARAYGYLKECGFVRPAYGDRCRRGRIDQSGRHIRSPDFVAIYIDDRSIVSQDSQSQVREDGCIGNAERASEVCRDEFVVGVSPVADYSGLIAITVTQLSRA